MTREEVIAFMRDTIGDLMAGVLEWDEDEAFAPAYETVLDRLGVDTTESPYTSTRKAREWNLLVKAEARLAIWERVRDHTAAFHYLLMPDGISAQLQQVHAHAAAMASEAAMAMPHRYGVEIDYLRVRP